MIYQQELKKKDMESINEVVELLKYKHNIILQGAPGTGKLIIQLLLLYLY